MLAGTNTAPNDLLAVRNAIVVPHSSDPVMLCLQGSFDFGNDSPQDGGTPIVPEHTDGGTMAEFNMVGTEGPAGKATINKGLLPVAIPRQPEVRRAEIHNLREAARTGCGIVPTRQARVLNEDNMGTTALSTIISANGAPASRGIALVNSASNDFQDGLIEASAVGARYEDSSNNTGNTRATRRITSRDHRFSGNQCRSAGARPETRHSARGPRRQRQKARR